MNLLPRTLSLPARDTLPDQKLSCCHVVIPLTTALLKDNALLVFFLPKETLQLRVSSLRTSGHFDGTRAVALHVFESQAQGPPGQDPRRVYLSDIRIARHCPTSAYHSALHIRSCELVQLFGLVNAF